MLRRKLKNIKGTETARNDEYPPTKTFSFLCIPSSGIFLYNVDICVLVLFSLLYSKFLESENCIFLIFVSPTATRTKLSK